MRCCVQVKEGAVLQGFVANVTHDGVFVRFAGHTTGVVCICTLFLIRCGVHCVCTLFLLRCGLHCVCTLFLLRCGVHCVCTLFLIRCGVHCVCTLFLISGVTGSLSFTCVTFYVYKQGDQHTST